MRRNNRRCYISNLFLVFALMMGSTETSAQEKPPVPIKVEVDFSKPLEFGTFTVGYLGTISVTHDGRVSTTGGVQELQIGKDASGALFDVYVNQGTIVRIQTSGNSTLTGSNGGTIYLTIDSFSSGQTFVATAIPPNPNPIFIGGTLSVGEPASAPPGHYSGQFSLTFIHE